MEEIYVYYESKNNKQNDSTTEVIQVFKSFKSATDFMKKQRELYIGKYSLIPHPIDGNGDKSWCRLYNKSLESNDYIDLIVEPKKIND